MIIHSNFELTITVVYVVVLVLGIAALLMWLAEPTPKMRPNSRKKMKKMGKER